VELYLEDSCELRSELRLNIMLPEWIVRSITIRIILIIYGTRYEAGPFVVVIDTSSQSTGI